MFRKSMVVYLILIGMMLAGCGGDDDGASVQGAGGGQSSSADTSTTADNPPSASSPNLRTSIINPTTAAQVVAQGSIGKATYYNFYWSSDGQTLAAMTTTDIRLYDVEQLGSPPRRFERFTSYVTFSPDGSRAISRTIDDETVVWDVASGEVELTLENDPFISPPQFSPDGQQIGAIREGAIQIWDADDGAMLDTIRLENGDISYFFYRNDGALLAVRVTDNAVEIWDVAENMMIFDVQVSGEVPVFGIQVSANGRVMGIPIPSRFAAQQGIFNISAVDLRDTHTGEQLNTTNHINLSLSPDGTTYVFYDFQVGLVVREVASDDEVIRLMDEVSNSSQFIGYFNPKFSPDNGMIAAMDTNGRIIIYRVTSGDRIGQINDSGSHVTTVDLHPDGKTLMIGSSNAGFTFWDITTGEIVRTERLGTANGAFYMGDGEQIIGVGGDVSVWDADSLQRSKLIMAASGGSPILNRDNTLFAMIEMDYSRSNSPTPDQYLRVWNIATDRMAMPDVTLSSDLTVRQQLFSPIDDMLAVAFNNSTIRLFNVNTGIEQNQLVLNEGDMSNIYMAFHPDGESILVAIATNDGGDGRTELYRWDMESAQADLVTTLDIDAVTAMIYNPDGTLLAVGGSFETGGIALLDAATLEILAAFGQQRQMARQLRFSPDGGVLITVGNDNIVRVWGVAE